MVLPGVVNLWNQFPFHLTLPYFFTHASKWICGTVRYTPTLPAQLRISHVAPNFQEDILPNEIFYSEIKWRLMEKMVKNEKTGGTFIM